MSERDSDIKIILGGHNHIPNGASHDEFESHYTRRLKPFITTLYKFPEIPVCLHYSGILLYWIERHHPEFLMLLDDLIARKQVELLGGGFYEPLMSLLSLSDRIGQIEMLTTYARKQFGKRPQGCWLPALAWDSSMVGILHTAGMAYTFLEEEQFLAAGVKEDGLEYPRITEDLGRLVTVFPIAARHGEALDNEGVEEVFGRITGEEKKQRERIVVLFPKNFSAVEKPGSQEPAAGTAESAPVPPELAMYRFFEALSAWQEKVVFTSPARVLKTLPFCEKVFFPSSAEKKFMNWALDSGADGGKAKTAFSLFPPPSKRFLIKYPEANGIYSKMIFTGLLINQLRGDKSRKRIAREELWKAQGYDVFCHTGDGGLYHNGLRKAAYRSLLEAERITREKGKFLPSLAAFDFDMDGEKEYLFQTEIINAYVKSQGASVFELDYLPKTWNYLDTVARRREPYAEGPLSVDQYRRSAFLDRLLPAAPSPEDAVSGSFPASRLCALERYEPVSMDRARQEAVFRLPCKPELPLGNIEIEKAYTLKKDTLKAAYTLTNRGNEAADFCFLTEIDLSFAGEDQTRQRIFTLRANVKDQLPLAETELRGIDEIELQDIKNEAVIYFRSSLSFDAWILPIRTRARIADEVKDYYQSTSIVPMKSARLEAGASVKFHYTLRFQH